MNNPIFDAVMYQDWGRYVEQAAHAIAADATAPHVLMRPALSVDGNKWCALYGENLQDGVAGFGDSPAAAMADFDHNWRTALPTAPGAGGQDDD